MYIYTVIFYQHDTNRNETDITVLGVFTDSDEAKDFLKVAADTEEKVTEGTHRRKHPTLAGRCVKETFVANDAKRDDNYFLEIKTTRVSVNVYTDNPYK